MRIMNIPSFLQMMGGISKTSQLVGVISEEVETPKHLQNLSLLNSEYAFVVVDLVGIIVANEMSYAKGKVLTIVGRSLLDRCKTTKSGKVAVVLSNANLSLASTKGVYKDDPVMSNFVQYIGFTKRDANVWKLYGAKHDLLYDKAKEYPEYYKTLLSIMRNNWNYNFPCDIPRDYTDACEGYEFISTDGRYMNDTNINANSASNNTNSFEDNEVATTALAVKIPTNIGVTGSTKNTNYTKGNTTTRSFKAKKLVVDNRDTILPRTKEFFNFESTVLQSEIKYKELINKVFDKDTDDEITDVVDITFNSLINYTGKAIKSNWLRSAFGLTGRRVFKEAIESILDEYAEEGLQDKSVIDMNLDILGTKLVDCWMTGDTESIDEKNKFLKAIVLCREEIYMKIIDSILSMYGSLVTCYRVSIGLGLNMLPLLVSNPYYLCLIDPSISLEHLDKLAMLYNVNMRDSEIQKSRDIAFMHNYMLDQSNRIIRDNTIVKRSELLNRVKGGYIISKRSYDVVQATGFLVTSDKIQALATYVNAGVIPQAFALPKRGWSKSGLKYALTTVGKGAEVIENFVDSGLGVETTLKGIVYISDFFNAKKEWYIIDKMYKISEQTTLDFSQQELDNCLKDFEAMKAEEFNLKEGEFKLETRQARAFNILSQACMCLTGSAGSGKTTTAEAIVFGLQNLLGYSDEDIKFCAPTGKAANRLKEVVKRETKTINSLFKIGESNKLYDEFDIPIRHDIKALVIDESSMINLNLMYQMMLRVSYNVRLYFLGDKEQAPPIGFGKPFANLLQFLPCIVLTVSKRASEKSFINKNAKALIEDSDKALLDDLKEGEDLKIINTQDELVVVDMIKNICKYHLGIPTDVKFKPVNIGRVDKDKIQVVSPINGKAWGIKNLNKELQDIFNPKDASSPIVLNSRSREITDEYRVGDRVIHSNSNLYERTRLFKTFGNTFDVLESTGITNGEVGVIESITRAADLDFSGSEKEADLLKEFPPKDEVVYIVVRYESVDIGDGSSDFYILYKANVTVHDGRNYHVLSRDLNDLDLAYALTIHKLQGSEAKLVLMALLPVGGDFISRNIIYTGLTRAKQGAYMLGDILGKDSCVARGRRIEQTELRESAIDYVW
ncbi:ATP-dependent RecD-like DNA helicase [compost metagenome]